MGPGKDFEKGLGIMNPPVFEPDQDLLTWRKKVASWVDLISTALVMGPGKDFEKGLGIMNPPVFEPDQDLLTWRKKVASWVDLISTAAEKGSDKLYKTVFCTLGRQLYDRGLRQAQQSLVDEAQEQGKIDYKQEDQIKAVQQIVDLIAKDPPIAVVTRLIDSFNKVSLCKRKPNEDLNRFVSRFRGFAAEHLMRAGTNNHSQIGEVLAITLLNNASLSEASLTNSKLRLIGMAEERSKTTENEENVVSIPHAECKKLLRRVISLKKQIEELESAEEIDTEMWKIIRKRYNKMAEATVPLIRQYKKSKDVSDLTKAIASNGPRCILSLDDAVSVLRSLAQSNSKIDQTVTKAQMDSVVDQKMRTFFGNQKGNLDKPTDSNGGGSSKPPKKRKNERAPAGNGERPTKRFRIKDLVGNSCMDCGDDDHTRGDAECKNPSFATVKLRQAREAEEGNRDGNTTNNGSYFHPGSKHTKGKRA